MSTHETDTYTVKLVDGPLEGRTFTMGLVDSEVRAKVEISASGGDKSYAYVRTSGGVEHSTPDGDGTAVTAADYRFLETVFA